MLAAYSTRRSSVVLNPRARVLAGLGDGDGTGDGAGFGFGDGAGADGTSTGNVGQGEGQGQGQGQGVIDTGLDLGNDVSVGQGEGQGQGQGQGVIDTGLDLGNDDSVEGTLATVTVSSTALGDDALDAITSSDLGEGAAMAAAANKAATDKITAAVITKGINLVLSKTGPLGAVLALVLSATGLTSAAVNAGMNGNSTTSSASINSAVDSAVGAVDIVNANPNLPQAVKTTVMTVQNNVATVNNILQANNFDLRSPAYKRFLPENGGKGIPALYQEIRDFISTHNKAEIDQAMTASGVSNADVIAAFQAVGTSQPGSGTNLAFLAAVAASYFILGA